MKASDLPDAEWNIRWFTGGKPTEYVLWTENLPIGTLFLFVDSEDGNVMECEANAAVHLIMTMMSPSIRQLSILLFDASNQEDMDAYQDVGDLDDMVPF